MDLFERLAKLHDEGLAQIQKVENEKKLNDVWVTLVGKKGKLTEILHLMKEVAPENRRGAGQRVNESRDSFNQRPDDVKRNLLKKLVAEKLKAEAADVTLPGRKTCLGSKHVVRIIQDDLERFFTGMGFQVVQRPKIETEHYSFEMLNLPRDYPTRDMQATFFVNEGHLLQSQTSPVQARTMEKHSFENGALKMISPGKVYRRDDDDATHSHQLAQMEGLIVDKSITMGDLRGTLEAVVRHVFGQDRETRLRPGYFPFTEPSVKMDVSCFNYDGKGCPVCKYTGWIEVLGAGMVHPNVIRNAGSDPEVYGGFAFGLGLDRSAILKYGVDDIRDFYTNDIRSLTQFRQEED